MKTFLKNKKRFFTDRNIYNPNCNIQYKFNNNNSNNQITLENNKEINRSPFVYSNSKTENLKEYDKLKTTGCLFQLNLLSTVEYYGKNITKITDKLLKNEYYDFVGSDVHHQNHIDAFNRKLKIKQTQLLQKVIENSTIIFFGIK